MTSYDIWTGRNLGVLANIGLPIFLLVISLVSFGWFVYELKRKRLYFRSMFSWFVLNIAYTAVIVYILIIAVLQYLGYERAVNVFDWISHYAFGFDLDGGQEYIFPMFFAMIAFILMRSLRNSIRIANLKSRVDQLSREVAVINGKIDETVDIKNKELLISRETTRDMVEKLRAKKRIVRAQKKLERVEESTATKIASPSTDEIELKVKKIIEDANSHEVDEKQDTLEVEIEKMSQGE